MRLGDKILDRICKQIAIEMNISEDVVESAINNCFTWIRNELIGFNYYQIFIRRLGTFRRIVKKIDVEEDRLKAEQYVKSRKRNEE
jgi:nucleoid DNA-binding protein